MKHIDPIERSLLLSGIQMKYGFDFSKYAEASLNRRLSFLLDKFEKASLLALLAFVLSSEKNFHAFLSQLTVTTTELFRDPIFFKALREKVIPVLKTYPRVNIWIAGCSTGQELVSLAILLKEEELLSRAHIYATDINPAALKAAQAAIYPIVEAQVFSKNYTASGGSHPPSDYYTAEYGLIRFDPSLFANVVYSEHNLITDEVFQEFHLVICRNVMIYFTKPGQEHVLQLLVRSLKDRGFLVIGNRENLKNSAIHPFLETVHPQENIFQYRKTGNPLVKAFKPHASAEVDS
jgi:chemotaxis protein methyltransferase CheR